MLSRGPFCSKLRGLLLVPGAGMDGFRAVLRLHLSHVVPGLCLTVDRKRKPEHSVGWCSQAGPKVLRSSLSLSCFHVPDMKEQISYEELHPFPSFSDLLFALRPQVFATCLTSDTPESTEAESDVESQEGLATPSMVVHGGFCNARSH